MWKLLLIYFLLFSSNDLDQRACNSFSFINVVYYKLIYYSQKLRNNLKGTQSHHMISTRNRYALNFPKYNILKGLH